MIKRALAHAAERHEEFPDRARKNSPRSTAVTRPRTGDLVAAFLSVEDHQRRNVQREGWRAAS